MGAAFDVDLNFAPGSVFRFEHLTIEDGLSQNAGLAIFQDSRGYLWIGTQDGLNRYDGYGSKIYKHDPDDPHSISYNSILSMGDDKNGSLWIGTWGGGLNQLDLNDPRQTDPKTATLTRYIHNADDSNSLSEDSVWSIHETADGWHTTWTEPSRPAQRRIQTLH
ncbi:MAG: hypothetical protein HOP27_01060 [Anaerolineales bacterium]|nr:hypothetical protein [Anaerolineales bacterium]